MVFMSFKIPREEDDLWDIIWLELNHIVSIRACEEKADHSYIEMDSGSSYLIIGYAEDLLDEIVREIGKTVGKDDAS